MTAATSLGGWINFKPKNFFFFFFTKWLLCKREMVTGPKETHLASADPEISFIFTSFFRVPPAPTGSLWTGDKRRQAASSFFFFISVHQVGRIPLRHVTLWASNGRQSRPFQTNRLICEKLFVTQLLRSANTQLNLVTWLDVQTNSVV